MAFADKDTYFLKDGARRMDSRLWMHYNAVVVTPAMALTRPGAGSDYLHRRARFEGTQLDGGKTYKLHVPPNFPVKDNWSVTIYDTQTRSMLQTDQKFAGINSLGEGVKKNADGSYDVYFAPEAPEGMREQLDPDHPRQELVHHPARLWPAGALARQDLAPKRARTGRVIQTGTREDRDPLRNLAFPGGYPTEDTSRKVFDELDLQRATQLYLDMYPALSAHGLMKGWVRDLDMRDSSHISVTADRLDSSALVLTGNTESLYAFVVFDLKKDGPTVFEVPPGVMGPLDDHNFLFVADIGPTGMDKGQGGKYLLLPPDYEGDVPDGYFVVRSPTYANFSFIRANAAKVGYGDKALEYYRKHAKVYPLKTGPRPPVVKNVTGIPWNSLRPRMPRRSSGCTRSSATSRPRPSARSCWAGWLRWESCRASPSTRMRACRRSSSRRRKRAWPCPA
jgi:hypothetical protein